MNGVSMAEKIQRWKSYLDWHLPLGGRAVDIPGVCPSLHTRKAPNEREHDNRARCRMSKYQLGVARLRGRGDAWPCSVCLVGQRPLEGCVTDGVGSPPNGALVACLRGSFRDKGEGRQRVGPPWNGQIKGQAWSKNARWKTTNRAGQTRGKKVKLAQGPSAHVHPAGGIPAPEANLSGLVMVMAALRRCRRSGSDGLEPPEQSVQDMFILFSSSLPLLLLLLLILLLLTLLHLFLLPLGRQSFSSPFPALRCTRWLKMNKAPFFLVTVLSLGRDGRSPRS